MIIPLLKHNTNIQNQRSKVKYLVNYFRHYFIFFQGKNRGCIYAEYTLCLFQTAALFLVNKDSVYPVSNISRSYLAFFISQTSGGTYSPIFVMLALCEK